ncbi:hypothetical protein PhCBS80983_g05222 [Powellomyces hirtus]|uniref:Condensin complex subunit 2 n=1 Tax=Powellomyces hirtus TaxID=109895 RepID=A0A507DW67_9FUNG|nr:hypothetical protein PhCBS80983_g05222 [Powellomyces hirtus]
MLAGEPKTPLRRARGSNNSTGHSSPATPLREISHEDEKRNMNIRRRKSLAEDRLRRQSVLFSPAGNRRQQPPVTPGRPKLSDAELRSSFEEWMKIAADNKINANNSWNLALIDYFYDMTLLRDGDSINFQKASCTLDGCVKIYTSRVDSVDSETKKLLSGLVDSNSRAVSDGEEDEQNAEGTKRTRRKAHRSGNTLEKDVNNLNVKKLDLEFMVDPLFKKTSADFDEGGAHGLLLNHLSISDEGKIIFDASDVGIPMEDSEAVAEHPDVERERIDLGKLKARFAGTLNTIWQQEVCPSLKQFEFSSESSLAMPFSHSSAFDDAFEDDNFNDDEEDDNPFYDEGNSYVSNGGGGGLEIGEFDEANIVSSMGPGMGGIGDAALVMMMGKGEDNIFSYFDTAMMRSWAGPEHWRSRPVLKDKSKTPGMVKKKRKIEETIDFLSAEAPDLAKLFAPATATITLPKQQEKTKSDHLLPDDMHFSSKDLLRLFLKPQYKIKFYRKDRSSTAPVDHNPDGPVDESFWAEHQMDHEGSQAHVDPAAGGEAGGFSDDDDDDDDDIADDPCQADPSLTIDFGDQLVDEPRKVKAVPLNYARVAKKVDSPLEQSDDEDGEEAHVQGRKTLTGIVKNLDALYPEKKRKDISVAFCFICILHLANEKNLQIEGEDGLCDLSIAQYAA